MKGIKVLTNKHYQTFSLPTFKFVWEKENTLNPYPYFTIWFVIGNLELGLHIRGKGNDGRRNRKLGRKEQAD